MSRNCVFKVDEETEFAEDEAYKKLRSLSVKPKVAAALVRLYEATDMSPDELDERAVEMLRGLPTDHALFVIKEVLYGSFLF